MIEPIRQVFDTLTENYSNPIERRRAAGLVIITWMLITISALVLAVNVLPAVLNRQNVPLEFVSFFAVVPMLAFVTHRLALVGEAMWAARLFTVVVSVFALAPVLNGLHLSNPLLLAIPLVTAGTLLNRRGVVLTLLVVTGAAVLGAIAQSRATQPYEIIPSATATSSLVLALIIACVIAVFLFVFNGNVKQIVGGTMIEVDHLRKIAEFTAEAESIEDEDAILTRAIDLVRVLGYTFAQVYVVDDEGNLTRRVRTGLGIQLTTVRQNLNIGDSNAISEAARTRQVVTVSLEDNEARRTHFLPAVNFSAAIPLLHQHKVIGVMDVQSDGTAPLTKSGLATLGLLANQIAFSVSYHRSTHLRQTQLQDQERITGTLREQLRELRQYRQMVVSSAWDEYLGRRGQEAVGFDLASRDAIPVPASDLPDHLRSAFELGEIQIEQAGDEQIINVPINLRGEVLGAMSFTSPVNQPVTEKQIELAKEVANRLAVALETKRLFEQSQAQAQRERKASEAATRLISTTDVKELLDLAATSFNDALGAIFTRIDIQPSLFAEPPAKLPVRTVEPPSKEA
jgi:GAF domain-containing protein